MTFQTHIQESENSTDRPLYARLSRFFREVAASPYYRTHPIETLRLGYARWLFSRSRINDPIEFLRTLNIDTNQAMAGFQERLPQLSAIVSSVWQHQGHQGGVSMQDGTVLYGLTRAMKPDYVIETGVAAGVSSSFICAALIENGHGALYSIELPPEESASRIHADGAVFDWPETGIGWAIPAEMKQSLGDRYNLTLRDVREALPNLLRMLPYVDIFFHDDLHTPDHMLWEFETVWPHLRSPGLVVADDVNFGWIRFARQHGLGESALRNIQNLSVICKR
jgi:hypothetical protein